MQHDDFAVCVTTEWNGWRSVTARLEELSGVHWYQPNGAPWPMLHAYMSCATLPGGAPSHACDPSSAPHSVRVCVLKSRNVPSAYAAVVRRANSLTIAREIPQRTSARPQAW